MREHRQGASGPVSVGASTVIDISANDTISLVAYGDAAFTIAGGDINLTFLLGFRVG
jgi:flagellar basal body rod protein FlgF